MKRPLIGCVDEAALRRGWIGQDEVPLRFDGGAKPNAVIVPLGQFQRMTRALIATPTAEIDGILSDLEIQR